jgi:hypothetical protein
MADKGMTLAIVLLVAGLIVGGGIGYFAAPSPYASTSDGNTKITFTVDSIRNRAGDTELTVTAKILFDGIHNEFIVDGTYIRYVDGM